MDDKLYYLDNDKVSHDDNIKCAKYFAVNDFAVILVNEENLLEYHYAVGGWTEIDEALYGRKLRYIGNKEFLIITKDKYLYLFDEDLEIKLIDKNIVDACKPNIIIKMK